MTHHAAKGCSRREFCAGACQLASGTAAVALGPLLPVSVSAAALAELPTVRGQVEGATVRVSIASTPLESQGGLARVVSNAGSFLVSRAADGTFVAVTATCSHEACLITGLEGNDYICDCHGSKFDTSGKVLFGPAETDLLRFGTAFSGGVLSIRLE